MAGPTMDIHIGTEATTIIAVESIVIDITITLAGTITSHLTRRFVLLMNTRTVSGEGSRPCDPYRSPARAEFVGDSMGLGWTRPRGARGRAPSPACSFLTLEMPCRFLDYSSSCSSSNSATRRVMASGVMD